MILKEPLNLKDKRIDKMLSSNGFAPENSNIFYSPLTYWVMVVGAICFGAVILSFQYPDYTSMLWYGVLVYVSIGYLFVAYANNSFVLSNGKLIAINANAPFKQFISFNQEMVSKVEIGNSWLKYFIWLLGDFNCHYVAITSAGKRTKFLCVGLTTDDAYGQKWWTEQTLNDLNTCLNSNGVKTNYKIKTIVLPARQL